MPLTVHDALEAWSEGRLSTERALALTGCADVDEFLRACDSSDVQRPDYDWHARRALLKAMDAALDASRQGITAQDAPIDEAAIEAEAVAAVRSAREEAIALARSAPDVPPDPGDELPNDPSKVRWRIEDGTGCSSRVQLHVRVLVGTERSTIIVADPITGRAIEHDVVQHGGEAGAAAAAVYAAIKRSDAKL